MANRKRNIAFSRPEEPEFIKKLKAKHGITRGPDIETKNETLPTADEEDLEDKDEEQPVIVVLKKGDLSEEEVKRIEEQNKAKEEELELKDKKIIFKKPDKSQTNDKKNDLIQSSVNKSKNESNIRQRVDENSVKTIKNSSLLSFNEEEEEEYSD